MSRVPTEQPRAVWCCSTCGAIYHKDFPRCPADGAEVVMAERDPLLGAVIDNYTVARLIGEGGMARVYLAHHASLPNKRYAIKVLLGDHAASLAMRQRFTREAERASQLDHPNVAKVVDFGQTRHGLLYIAMEYVEGPSLAQLIGDQPMASARVISLARAICRGLVYAHDAGIVHRDLKPENILVTTGPDGEVPRIVDFGLAMSLDQTDARLTESGMTMGTPAFAAPEQLSGKPIDHRADLYAFGMTMFEMLTGGQSPFEGHIMEVVSARTAKDAPRVSQRRPDLDIPAALDDIVAGLTRRKPADRYQSAREVIEALDAVRLGPEARIATEPTPTVASPRRRARLAVTAVAVLAAGGLAAGAWTLAAGPGGRSTTTLSEAPPRAPSPPVEIVQRAVPEPVPASAPAEVRPAAAPPIAAALPDAVGDKRGSASKHRRPARDRAARPVLRVDPVPVPVAEPAPSQLKQLVPAAPVPPAPATVPPPPAELFARIDGVDVNGSLPVREVQRAVDRRRAAIGRCVPAAPGAVVAHFTIGEGRRARGVRATGSAAEINACVAAALGDLRTEGAPDVGEVEVTVRIAFVVKT